MPAVGYGASVTDDAPGPVVFGYGVPEQYPEPPAERQDERWALRAFLESDRDRAATDGEVR